MPVGRIVPTVVHGGDDTNVFAAAMPRAVIHCRTPEDGRFDNRLLALAVAVTGLVEKFASRIFSSDSNGRTPHVRRRGAKGSVHSC